MANKNQTQSLQNGDSDNGSEIERGIVPPKRPAKPNSGTSSPKSTKRGNTVNKNEPQKSADSIRLLPTKAHELGVVPPNLPATPKSPVNVNKQKPPQNEK